MKRQTSIIPRVVIYFKLCDEVESCILKESYWSIANGYQISTRRTDKKHIMEEKIDDTSTRLIYGMWL